MKQKENQKVLLIEDDGDISDALSLFLNEEGYQVQTAANGKEGLEKLKENRPGIILLDLMMPVMTGWEFIEIKNKLAEYKNVPVLVISAVHGAPYIPGVLACLKKPLDLERIIDFVELYCHGDELESEEEPEVKIEQQG